MEIKVVPAEYFLRMSHKEITMLRVVLANTAFNSPEVRALVEKMYTEINQVPGP